MNKKEIEATEKLAAAMDKMAIAMNNLQDPIKWQKIMSDAARTLAPIGQPLLRAQPVPGHIGQAVGSSLGISPPVPVGSIDVPSVLSIPITLTLSDADRDDMVKKVSEALKPELKEFETFVNNSLKKMPAHRLKSIADKVDKGVPIRLQQRVGCIYIQSEDSDAEAYLGL
jgi:hypothetical protein